MSLAATIQYLFPGIDMLRECVVQDDGTGPRIVRWNRPEPQPTPAELAAAGPLAEAAMQAEQAARAEAAADKAELREQFQAAADRLQQIADAQTPTNPQVVQAVRDLAAMQRKMLRAVFGILTE